MGLDPRVCGGAAKAAKTSILTEKSRQIKIMA
jgi:hypothetical protein